MPGEISYYLPGFSRPGLRTLGWVDDQNGLPSMPTRAARTTRLRPDFFAS